MMISVIDYGAGNVGAIVKALDYLGVESNLVQSPTDILKADKLILPGVGAFDTAIRNLRKNQLDQAILDSVLKLGTPILGVCLGMQLLGKSSEEGLESGLGLIDAHSFSLRRFQGDFKVPNMGWLSISVRDGSRLLPTVEGRESRFYFAHSFYVDCTFESDVAAYSYYGDRFVAAIERENIFGVQFHPEKSHKFGLSLLSKFSDL